MPVQLRDYQKDTIDATERCFAQGHTDVLNVLATGGGKTTIGLELIARNCAQGERAIWLAHREELITQPAERMAAMHPAWERDTGIVMGRQNECAARLVIATIQTISGWKRLEQYLRYGPPALLVFDECHHATAKTYVEFLTALKAINPKLRHVGFTATPKRSDQDGLSKVYQTVAARYGIKELMQGGWLCPITAVTVKTPISLSGVKKSHGDYNQAQLASVMDVDNAFDLVVQTHLDQARDRQAICFTVGVAGAHLLAEKFNAAGIRAAACDGTTPKDERRDILDAFRRGDLDVLTNCNVFTEGLDLPMISAVHWCRPTDSDTVYMQGIGRGLRTHPGKVDCTIFDYVPLDGRDIVQAGDVLGVPLAERRAQERAAKSGAVLTAFSFDASKGGGLDGDPDQLVVEHLNLLAVSPYAWFWHDDPKRGGELATLGLDPVDLIDETSGAVVTADDGRPVKIERSLALTKKMADGHYRLVCLTRVRGRPGTTFEVVAKDTDYAALQETGCRFAEAHGAGTIARRDRGWQRDPVSEKQLEVLRRTLPEGEVGGRKLEDLNRGEAMRLITHFAVRKELVREATRMLKKRSKAA